MRNRLLAVVTVSSLGSVILTGILLASLYSLTAKREAYRDLSRQVDILAEEVGRILRSGGEVRSGVFGTARRIPLRAVLNSGRLDYVGVWELDGSSAAREVISSGESAPTAEGAEKLFARLDSEGASRSRTRANAATADIETVRGEEVASAAQVVPGTDGRLVVIAARRAALPDARVLGRLILAALVGLAISVGLAYWLSRRILAPLAEMERTALAIASGDYSARVSPPKDPELARLADAMNSMAAEVEATRIRERNLLMTISHDLRTPLTSIRAYAEAIADGTVEGKDEITRAAGLVASEAARLGRMVDVLFDAARLGSGQLELQIEEVDLCEIIEDVASVFASRAERLGIRLETKCQSPAIAQTDGDRVAQVLSNLIDNALKNTPSGGLIEVGVEAAPASSGSRLRLWVADTGRGIPRADLERIFEPGFSSGRRTEGGPGLGLGLAIVKGIVTALGGRIEARSEEGKGTTFSIYIS